MTLEADVQQGWHDAIVEMFDFDLQPITGDIDDIFYFTNQLKPDNTKIQWKGNIYEPLPIISAGYEKNTTGQIAQPSLTVANVLGTFTEAVESLEDLVGTKIVRRRTLGKYLDGESNADPSQEFPIDIFYIERKASENVLSITWQLTSVLDLEGLRIPRRIVTQNYCQWKYRSSECSYIGAPVFDANDAVISTIGRSPEAVAVLSGYTLVQQRKTELQNANNALNAAIAAREAACAPFAKLSTQFNVPNYYVFTDPEGSAAVWSGNSVALNQTYRQGKNQGNGYFSIEEWGQDVAGCAVASGNVITAQATVATASGNLVSAQNSLTAATIALPLNDELWSLDVCGKRVESCRLRFPEQSLPFGGFPGAIRGR